MSTERPRHIFDEIARVEEVVPVAEGHFRLRLKAPAIAQHARPGQFVNILCGNTFLRRPFSVHRVERPFLNALNLRMGKATERDTERGADFEILFKVVGKGTQWLSKRQRGEELRVLGPLGRGFEIPGRISTAILIGGGCGAAPLYFLAEELRIRDIDTYLFVGAEDEATLPVRFDPEEAKLPFDEPTARTCMRAVDFEEIGVQTALTTTSGNAGFKGLVTDVLQLFLDTLDDDEGSQLMAYASGKWEMLKKTASMLDAKKIPCQVLLEEMMCCGMGICMSCSIPTRSEEGKIVRKRVCLDGPMFYAHEVCWHE